MENSYYRKTSRFLKKITLSVCFFISWALYCEEVEINYCFKKVHSLDPGTLHFFLNNNSKNEIKVEKLYFNDIEIEEGQETDDIFWWTQVPNVALPGQVSNIMIKIKKILSLPVKIKLKLNTGQFLEKHIDSLVPEFFRISSISFDITENKVYIYLENNFPNKTIEISDIFVNKKSILNSVKKLSKFILPGEKICIVYSSFEKINPNQYIPIKVITQDGMITGALPRVYNYFPIQSFGEDKRKEMFFNEDNFDIHFPTDIKKFENYKCEPLYKVYHLFDDPVCTDEKRGFLGATAKEVIKRRKICWEKDPFHPTFIYICEYCKPRGYFIYSELADIIGVDPYELVY